jgi:putative SOS response-associated peptidase YedK
MCYDISLYTAPDLISNYLPEIQFVPLEPLAFESIFHIQGHAFHSHPVLLSEDGRVKMQMFEWGLVAAYMNTPEKIKENRVLMLNARSEKLIDKKSYWYRIRKQRCLVPVNGFFEHREIQGMKKKVPYFISMKEQPLFFMAGLYNYSPVPDKETGELTGTFTVITRPANDLMKKIHNHGPNKWRMPLLLHPSMVRELMDPATGDEAVEQMLQYEMPSESMNAWPVKTIRTSHGNDDTVLEICAIPGLPSLDEPPVLKIGGTLF